VSSSPSTAALTTDAPTTQKATTQKATTKEVGTQEKGGAPASASRPAPSIEAIRALARCSRLLERASGEVNLAHYRVLAAIASGDERASRIAAKLALGKPTISASVESLRKRGLLASSGVEGDQRATALQITPEGKRWLSDVEAAMAAWLVDVCARTSDPGQTLQALVSMGEAIEQMAAESFAEGVR
jgi:DNA-binding MarR family transcriptional regulator